MEQPEEEEEEGEYPQYLNFEKEIPTEDIFSKDLIQHAKNLTTTTTTTEIPKLELNKIKEEEEEEEEEKEMKITKTETPTSQSKLLNSTYEYFQKVYNTIFPYDQSALEQCKGRGAIDKYTDKYTPRNKVPMEHFLNACDYIYLIFIKISPTRSKVDAFQVAQKDMLQNITRLKQQYTKNKTVGFKHLHDSPFFDYLAILWLNRSLEFIAELLRLITNSELTMSECAKGAYKQTLKHHHNNIMGALAEYVLKYTPTKKDFLLAVSDGLYRDSEMFELEKSRHGRENTEKPTESETVMTLLTFISLNIKQICEYNNEYLRIHQKKKQRQQQQ